MQTGCIGKHIAAIRMVEDMNILLIIKWSHVSVMRPGLS